MWEIHTVYYTDQSRGLEELMNLLFDEYIIVRVVPSSGWGK